MEGLCRVVERARLQDEGACVPKIQGRNAAEAVRYRLNAIQPVSNQYFLLVTGLLLDAGPRCLLNLRLQKACTGKQAAVLPTAQQQNASSHPTMNSYKACVRESWANGYRTCPARECSREADKLSTPPLHWEHAETFRAAADKPPEAPRLSVRGSFLDYTDSSSSGGPFCSYYLLWFGQHGVLMLTPFDGHATAYRNIRPGQRLRGLYIEGCAAAYPRVLGCTEF